ncbi:MULTISPECIES: hypothetical protein [Caballeronia]|uniref:Uncharacterized protein n=1 Tax=Caballeronia cordobensis TaxID=1353886 RepID=A0A158FFK0_CABCO|nr:MULTISPECIES: hypothetical protein [Caballeronia]BAO85905.1 hypothetical protein BRPE67_ACDS08500 [Burkholderia sp. RPE67]BBP95738.1 hypothetical protein BSFA1_08670 [Burkholderia sp. SFA1]MCE4542361.1 hypothetical protein [Caballeronia sp. PC1]MCE4568584.1 hypothetical protein [Caballeronia sp. CLC5]SAL18471.1 hypothetical protein AWB70_00838 [Caballeronia cordobensis]
MIEISRHALAQSGVAGGAAKQSGKSCPIEPSTPTQSGMTSTLVVVDGKVVVDRTVVF